MRTHGEVEAAKERLAVKKATFSKGETRILEWASQERFFSEASLSIEQQEIALDLKSRKLIELSVPFRGDMIGFKLTELGQLAWETCGRQEERQRRESYIDEAMF